MFRALGLHGSRGIRVSGLGLGGCGCFEFIGGLGLRGSTAQGLRG